MAVSKDEGAPAALSHLDLNADQTAAVEAAVGIPIQRWGHDQTVSTMDINREMAVALGIWTAEEAAAKTNREVLMRVSLAPEDPKDPTAARSRRATTRA